MRAIVIFAFFSACIFASVPAQAQGLFDILNEITKTPATPSKRMRAEAPAGADDVEMSKGYRMLVQRGLNAEGIDVGVTDGIFGSRTRAGISEFQAGRGESRTGYLTEDQAEFLRAMGMGELRMDYVDVITQEIENHGAQCAFGDGFVRPVDANGDGRMDVMTDGRQIVCEGTQFYHCGTAGCPIAIYLHDEGNRFTKVTELYAHELVFDDPNGEPPSFVATQHGSACGRSGAEGCIQRFAIVDNGIELVATLDAMPSKEIVARSEPIIEREADPKRLEAVSVECIGVRGASVHISERPKVHIRLSGMFGAGGAERIIGEIDKAVEDDDCGAEAGWFRQYVLNLDSDGGSFVDALRVAHHVRGSNIGTHVDAGASCLSACALVFMAGAEGLGDGYIVPHRTLHYRGVLGFHAPFVGVAQLERVPDEALRAFVTNAYEVAIEAASDLTLLAIEAQWRPSLVREILETPSSEMMYVDRISEAGTWGIELEGLPQKNDHSREDLMVACANFYDWELGHFDVTSKDWSWAADQLQFQHEMDDGRRIYAYDSNFVVSLSVRDAETGEEYSISEEGNFGQSCDFFVKDGVVKEGDAASNDSLRVVFRSYYSVPGYHTFAEAAEWLNGQ